MAAFPFVTWDKDICARASLDIRHQITLTVAKVLLSVFGWVPPYKGQALSKHADRRLATRWRGKHRYYDECDGSVGTDNHLDGIARIGELTLRAVSAALLFIPIPVRRLSGMRDATPVMKHPDLVGAEAAFGGR